MKDNVKSLSMNDITVNSISKLVIASLKRNALTLTMIQLNANTADLTVHLLCEPELLGKGR